MAILAISISLCSCVVPDETSLKAPQAENEFNISILKIGQADAIILKTENHTAVIDCDKEDNGDGIVEYLSNIGAESIDYLFITHFNKKHSLVISGTHGDNKFLFAGMQKMTDLQNYHHGSI